MKPFEQVCWEVLLPRLRTALQRDWNVHIPEPAITLLEVWAPILPVWASLNLRVQLVVPKLEQAVELWDPRTDPVPIHVWLHPWLPLMGDDLKTVFPVILRKLAGCLQLWHPSDPSAHAILLPWKDALTDRQMSIFVKRTILPKLDCVLDAFVIDPANQCLDPLLSVLAWQDLMPFQDCVDLLQKHFFPKFLRVLCEWLSVNDPDYAEICLWYSNWKMLFSNELLRDSRIRSSLHRALEFMLRTVTGADYELARMSFPSRSSLNLRQPPSVPLVQRARDVPKTLKDLITQRAHQEGILFMPKPGRTQNGKPVYVLGNSTLLYIDNAVVFTKRPGAAEFEPTSVDSAFGAAF